MRYRRMGDLNVSILGLGAMRLPLKADGKKIDKRETDRMIRYGIERGINYIDTAAPYHDGRSEEVVGKILSAGLRDKVLLATKLPCWLVQTAADFDRLLQEQLRKLRTDRIDVYLLHALFTERWEGVRRLGVLDWLEKKKAAGVIGRVGFSFHDNFEVFKQILNAYDKWDMCQIQYNYMDEDFQAGTLGLRLASARNVPVVVMEPLRGGFLAAPPASIRSLFDEADLHPVRAALRWLWAKPEITTVLSGMSNLRQVTENADLADASEKVTLSEAEVETIGKARAAYEKAAPIPCTQCGYCLPCPSGVAIPDNISLYNKCVIFDNIESGKVQYLYHTPDPLKAAACTGCRECEDKCPQRIPVSEWMPKIDRAFTTE